MNDRDNCYYFHVTNITAEEADNLAHACRKAKRDYASSGRGTSFSGKTKDLGKHLACFADRKRIKGN